jgi:hypothetical protein
MFFHVLLPCVLLAFASAEPWLEAATGIDGFTAPVEAVSLLQTEWRLVGSTPTVSGANNLQAQSAKGRHIDVTSVGKAYVPVQANEGALVPEKIIDFSPALHSAAQKLKSAAEAEPKLAHPRSVHGSSTNHTAKHFDNLNHQPGQQQLTRKEMFTKSWRQTKDSQKLKRKQHQALGAEDALRSALQANPSISPSLMLGPVAGGAQLTSPTGVSLSTYPMAAHVGCAANRLERSNISNANLLMEGLARWKRIYPTSLVYIDDSESSCLLFDGTPSGPKAAAWTGAMPRVLTIASKMEPAQCKMCLKTSFNNLLIGRSPVAFNYDVADGVPRILPQTFPVKGPMLAHGGDRLFGISWPPVGTCNSANRCPLIVFLGGRQQKGSTQRDFEHFKTFGFLNYVQCDGNCAKKLGAVHVFPMLTSSESFTHDGPIAMAEFVVPLTLNLLRTHASMLDAERVTIIGMSQSLPAALIAAVRYPHVYSLVMTLGLFKAKHMIAETPMLSLGTRKEQPTEPLELAKSVKEPQRLRHVLVAGGDK